MIQKEKEEGVRQRFPRNDYCANCDLPCVYAERIRDFEDWLYRSKRQVMVVEYQDKDGNTKRKVVPKLIRFSEYYTKRVRRKFYRLIPHLMVDYEVMFFLTLTVRPNWDLKGIFDQVSERCHRVFEILRKRLERQGIGMDYIKVYEPTEKGVLHVHVVLFLSKFPMRGGKVWLIDKKELDEIWGLGHTWLGWEDERGKMIWLSLKRNGKRNAKKALNYLLKYISKAHKNKLFASLIWGKGKGGGLRSWTLSRRLSSYLSEDIEDIPKTGVVVWFGYVWDVPDWVFLAEFNGQVVSSKEELEDLLIRWWDDVG